MPELAVNNSPCTKFLGKNELQWAPATNRAIRKSFDFFSIKTEVMDESLERKWRVKVLDGCVSAFQTVARYEDGYPNNYLIERPKRVSA